MDSQSRFERGSIFEDDGAPSDDELFGNEMDGWVFGVSSLGVGFEGPCTFLESFDELFAISYHWYIFYKF